MIFNPQTSTNQSGGEGSIKWIEATYTSTLN